MKRFLSVFLPLVLLLMTLASCQRVDPSDYPDATNPPSEQEQQIAALKSAMEFSDPFSADSTVTLTISEDLKLVSTFKVNKDGNCVYNIQRLKPYELGSTDTNMIETFKGTKKASASPEDGVFVSQLTFDFAYFSDYTMVGVSGITFTGEVADEFIDDFLGFALDATALSVTIEVNAGSYVDSITLNYTTAYGTVEVVSVYAY